MPSMNIFESDAFSMTSLSSTVERIDYVPQFLSSIPDLFVPDPVRTEDIWIEEDSSGAVLIMTTPRGAPPRSQSGTKRKARNFKTVRIADSSRITAAQVAGIRAKGSETELQTVQAEVARRLMLMKNNASLTWENLRFSCIQGVTKDADGSTIYDWASEFGQTIPAEVNFDLTNASPASGALRIACTAAVRSITKGLKGVTPRAIMAICGDAFWDALTAHSEVRQTYLNWQAAADLRSGNAWDTFNFGGINWVNYRGTDDGTTLGVNTYRAKFFPVGSGIFRWAQAPGESFEDIGTLGQQSYAMSVPDRDRNRYVDIEFYSYPLPVCTTPQALYQARRASAD